MQKTLRTLLLSAVLLSAVNISDANAAEERSVSCSVSIDYLFNGVVRAPYQKDFVVTPGVRFEDDFSTPTRFRIFDASTRLEDGKTVVVISYFNDVGVFESVDFNTELKLNDEKGETRSGSHTFFTSRGAVGSHTTNYTLSCSRLKN